MEAEKQKKRTVKIFALASFLNDLGSDMIYPIWPLFVTSFLGANMAVLGFIDGLGDAIVSISQAFSGYLSDKLRKRKFFIWLGYSFGAGSRIGYALSFAWQHLIPFRILDRSGKMRGAPRDAMIADASTNRNRGRNFGFLRAMDNLGAVCGIVISILFFSLLGYKKLFLIAAVPSIIGVLLILFFIKEKKLENVSIYKGFSFKDLSLNFKLFLFLSSIFALGSFSYSFLLIYAKQFGFNLGLIPALYLLFTVVTASSSLPFGKLADKIGRKAVLFLSFLMWAAVCLSIILFQNYWAIILVFVIYGLHRGALDPVQKTFVAEISPKEYRATGLGTFQMITGLFALPASLLAGIFWDKISIFFPFYISLGLTVLSILLLAFVKEDKI